MYAYDQQERLEVVSSALGPAAASGAAGRAIDFGCGTGDFSRRLLDRGFEVCGYDPFVEPRLTHRAFTYARRYEDIPYEAASVDLVLSVTVMDHLLEADELDRALELIREKLKPGGVLLLLEYCLDDEGQRTEAMADSSYQAFRTRQEWTAHLANHAFSHEETWTVPHPVENPSTGYRAFRRSPVVRAVSRCRLQSLAPPLARHLLGWAASRQVARHPPSLALQGHSPLKLMRLSRG